MAKATLTDKQNAATRNRLIHRSEEPHLRRLETVDSWRSGRIAMSQRYLVSTGLVSMVIAKRRTDLPVIANAWRQHRPQSWIRDVWDTG